MRGRPIRRNSFRQPERQMVNKRWVCLAIAVLAAWVVGAGVAHAGGTPSAEAKPVDFKVMDLKGNECSLARWTADRKAVLVNFWGIRCGACIEEIPHLNAIYNKYRDKLVVIGVNVDGIKAPDLDKHLSTKGPAIDFPVIPDPEFGLVEGFQVKGAPMTILVGPDGLIRYRHENFEPGDEKKIEQAVADAISGK